MSADPNTPVIAEEDRLRADMYDFLAALLARAPDRVMLQKCAALSADPSPLGDGIHVLTGLAKVTQPTAASREFNGLFIGLGRGELLPYASYYMTGFLNEKPLATLRNDMAALGMKRAETVFEPEDNIASLCEMMAGLIDGRFGTMVGLAEQRTFFNRHIAPWAAHFFSDLEGAELSVFYAPVGTIGRVFMEIEKEAFRMAAAD
ncbi:MAG: molecular chaperone TorD family protein [Pseudomonadota bacterium]